MSTRSSSGASQVKDDAEDHLSLSLVRTKSHEFSIAESVAVAEPQSIRPLPDSERIPFETQPVSWVSTKYRVLLCGFLTSLSFGVTQVPLLYIFRLMTCDAYYDSREASAWRSVPFTPWLQISDLAFFYVSRSKSGNADDRCSIHPIESSTALSIALVGASTTVFGIVNLFLAGALIKRIGVQRALILQTFFPAVRLLIQNIGVEVWGYMGILIIQCSQIVTIAGGPSGYILALNQFITDIVKHEERTATLGRLQGVMLFGGAFGFLIGGLVAEAYSIKAPFRLTLILFMCSTAFVIFFLPHIPPTSTSRISVTGNNTKVKSRSYDRFVGPLRVFAPRRFVLRTGSIKREYGAFLLACGVYLGILATGYLPTLLQLYSTDVFGFATKQNGWLIFMYSLLRGCFLTFLFPKLIAEGRKYIAKHQINGASESNETTDTSSSERAPLLEDRIEQNEQRNASDKQGEVFKFDLIYTRLSIVADGLLTLLCTFLHEGWQMYVVAAVLPFSAGTGSAAKGTVLQIVGASASSNERTDALAGISLIENAARLTTTFVFGAIFAAFTNLGRPELTFTVNACSALLAFLVLLYARFPPEGSQPLSDVEISEPVGEQHRVVD